MKGRTVHERARLWIIGLLAISMGVLWWSVSSGVRGTTFTLSNGDEITFHGISVGTNCSHCYGNLFQRMAARLPSSLDEKLSGGTVARAFYADYTNVAFWFLYRGEGNPFTRLEIRVADDQGLEVDPQFHIDAHAMDEPATGIYYHRGILPQRSRSYSLRLYEKRGEGDDRRSLVGELRIPNPLACEYPQWSPEPLPATRHLGSLTVTLEEITLALETDWRDLANNYVQKANVVHARVRLTETNQPTDDWAFFGARWSDATGEFTPVWFVNWQWLNTGVLEFSGRWPLWPGEKTVKLQTLWVRKQVQPPDRVVTFYGVPLPPLSPVISVIASTNHPLGEIKISCRPTDWPASGEQVLELFSSDPRFYRYQDAEVECYYFQDARDDKARPLERLEARKFRVPSGVKSVDLAIHLPKAKKADFVVSPRIISTNRTAR